MSPVREVGDIAGGRTDTSEGSDKLLPLSLLYVHGGEDGREQITSTISPLCLDSRPKQTTF